MQNKKQENANFLTNPEELKKFKSVLVSVTHYLHIIDEQRDAIKENIEEAATIFSIDKRIIRKLANVMYKSNYADIQEENNHFELLYEALIASKIQNIDPLDQKEEEEDDNDI